MPAGHGRGNGQCRHAGQATGPESWQGMAGPVRGSRAGADRRSLTGAMDGTYAIDNSDEIYSPGLVVFEEMVRKNTAHMLALAGHPRRLRPHCKTHKMLDIVRMQVGMGIVRHKCATFAEAEMLAIGGARDVFLAYNPVGPNIGRAVRFRQRYPQVRLAVAADHPEPVRALDAAMAAAGIGIDVFLDIDTGLGRSGLVPGPDARALYEEIERAGNLRAAGLHVYDGQNHQTGLEERKVAVDECWKAVQAFRNDLESSSLTVPAVVAGGTGTFAILAGKDDPALELSPGTSVLHDDGYQRQFPDLQFVPAALILTRVVSRPSPNRVTFDLGHKACAADPPAGRRLRFPGIPDARAVLQNEEHLVIETARAASLRPGDALLAIPGHVCPTVALHAYAWVVRDGRARGRWPVTARDREISL